MRRPPKAGAARLESVDRRDQDDAFRGTADLVATAEDDTEGSAIDEGVKER
jgi:hypothetical protein